MAKTLKNIELLKKVGVDYSFFTGMEIGEIIKLSILDKKGSKAHIYKSILTKVNGNELVKNIIKYGDNDVDDLLKLIEFINKHMESMKEDEIKKIEEKIEELKKKKELLKK